MPEHLDPDPEGSIEEVYINGDAVGMFREEEHTYGAIDNVSEKDIMLALLHAKEREQSALDDFDVLQEEDEGYEQGIIFPYALRLDAEGANGGIFLD